MIGYQLWETRSRNLLEAFDTEGEALAAVARTATRYGDAVRRRGRRDVRAGEHGH